MIFQPTIKRRDMINCALCDNAPCDKACPAGLNPSTRLRSIWFGGEQHSVISLPALNACEDCQAPCEKACLNSGMVSIKKLISRLKSEIKATVSREQIANEDVLQTDICGIPLENPFLLSSSVVSSNYDMCARAFEAGWAGVSFKTICNFHRGIRLLLGAAVLLALKISSSFLTIVLWKTWRFLRN